MTSRNGNTARRLFTTAALLLAGGCKVGPSYQAPETAPPDGFRELKPGSTGIVAESDGEVRWWRRFGDPQLADLVDRAIVANPSIVVAEARLGQARAAREAAQALLYPEIHARASLFHFRGPSGALDMPEGALNLAGSLYQAGFDAVWVADVFGGTRRQIESAQAGEEAFEARRRGVVLMVAAETARAYVELRGFQRRLDVSMASLEERRMTMALTKEKHENGLASDLDLLRARGDVESTEAQIPPLQQAIRQYIHLLSTLLALEPTALSEELTPVAPIPEIPRQVLVGMPLDMLRRRPDIRVAERVLASATAQVGVAKSKLYPQLAIGGTAGIANRTDNNLSLDTAGYYATGPFVDWTIFDAGRRRAGVKASEAEVVAAKASYEDTVRRAFAEVESGLVAVDRSQAQREALRRLRDTSRKAVEIAQGDYGNGLLDQLDVLEAQRQADQADLLLAQSEVAVTVNVVILYKALGGGWEVAEPRDLGQVAIHETLNEKANP